MFSRLLLGRNESLVAELSLRDVADFMECRYGSVGVWLLEDLFV